MRRYTEREDALLLDRSLSARVLSASLGRTEGSIRKRRWLLRRRRR